MGHVNRAANPQREIGNPQSCDVFHKQANQRNQTHGRTSENVMKETRRRTQTATERRKDKEGGPTVYSQQYAFEQQIRVMLEFRAMDEPVEISVPWKVLFYLDTHAERRIGADGTVIYHRPLPDIGILGPAPVMTAA
jgi:hypothetical protein